MSTLSFLATELQSLASETRRKHPEIREAAEKSIAILKASPEQSISLLSQDVPQSEELLRPVFMGCATKNAKVVAISLGSLQRLISMRAVSPSHIPKIISLLGDSLSQGVDIQLKVLQTLLSLLTNYRNVHDDLLGDALLLCFRLQESRIAVVSSTAAATLRQLVMFVFDKVVDDDKVLKNDENAGAGLPVELPDGTTVNLHPSARDAFSVFEDLCLLANSEQPNFLKLESLPKTFALELIESALTNYHELFRLRKELLSLLQHHLCPLLLKSLSEKPLFPLTLRSTRVVFLLLKQFLDELFTEAEVFLMLLVRVISGDSDSVGGPGMSGEVGGVRPPWMRVLAMEIIRGICSDGELMRKIWQRYDSQVSTGSKVYTSLVSALKRLATEKPALLGSSPQMMGVGVQSHSTDHVGGGATTGTSSYGFEVAGRVASVATATVSNVVGMIASGSGLSLVGSTMKIQCIDQLDKADSPAIPDSYIYLLVLQSLVALADGFAAYVFPLYTTIVIQRPRAAGETSVRAPPALDLTTLNQDDPTTRGLQSVNGMVDSGWPGLLSALSFFISTNLSDELFGDVLGAFQNLTNVSGVLNLRTPRDAFLMSLSRLAIPPGVVSSIDTYMEPSTPRQGSVSDALGLASLTGGGTQVPGLSERNMACLKTIISTALYLSGSLGSTWFDILELLQNADYVMFLRGLRGPNTAKTPIASTKGFPGLSNSPIPPTANLQPAPRHPLLSDIDIPSVQAIITRLFDTSKNLDDDAFKDFVAALCKLSGEMVGMQSARPSGEFESVDDLTSPTLLVPGGSSTMTAKQRRRVSGMNLTKTLRSGDYGITRLGSVALLNIHRLIYRDPEIAWNTVTSHLLSVICNPTSPPSIRQQAAEVLDEILVVVPRNLTSTGPLQAQVQKQVLDVLSRQMFVEPGYGSSAVVVDIQRLALETLYKILQFSGHSLVVGWELIFEMLGSVAQPVTGSTEASISPSQSTNTTASSLSVLTGSGRNRPLSLQPAPKSSAGLTRIAFQSLTLVCDSLDSLSPDHLRLCITTLGQFGRQQDTNIALTAAESLLWGVSDSIQAKRKNAEKEPEYSELWTFLLLELRGLCTDARHEVRFGAIQTLFRTLQLYGATLSLETWDECMWKVIFPLLDDLSIAVKQAREELLDAEPSSSTTITQTFSTHKNPWDESKSLSLQSIGTLFHDFLISKIMYLASFAKAWDAFVEHVTMSFLRDSRLISTAALRCLDKALKASKNAGGDLHAIAVGAWERVWTACDDMGKAVVSATSNRLPPPDEVGLMPMPFTQESLLAFVEVIQSAYSLNGSTWDLERIQRMLAILKGIMTYSSSTDYRPDIDLLTPVQAAVMQTLEGLQINDASVSSLVLCDVAEYSTLAFLASFEYEEPLLAAGQTDRKPTKKRITYIGLSKKTMPLLVNLFLRFQDELEIYENGTLERILSAYSVPVKLKYDAPAPSKFGSDPPLWKTATICFLKVIKVCTPRLRTFHERPKEFTAERIEGIWWQILDLYRGGLLADCSFVDTLSQEAQEAEEQFDLSLVTSLEVDVVPHLGDQHIPDHLIVQLGRTLQIASRIHDLDVSRMPYGESSIPTPPLEGPSLRAQMARSTSFDAGDASAIYGTTNTGILLPRERMSYWCFDLLFHVCSDSAKEYPGDRRRLAALTLPALLNRCKMTLSSYVADVPLRGLSPLPRVQEEELLYVLRKMLEISLWPGCLWAAFSEEPSKNAETQPKLSGDPSGQQVIADTARRSTKAHLFHFYDLLCDVTGASGRSPSMWIVPSRPEELVAWGMPHALQDGFDKSIAVEISARQLSRSALKSVGREMGALS